MLFDCISPSYLRKGEELKAPRHASAAATRDGNLPIFLTISFIYKFISNLYYLNKIASSTPP